MSLRSANDQHAYEEELRDRERSWDLFWRAQVRRLDPQLNSGPLARASFEAGWSAAQGRAWRAQ